MKIAACVTAQEVFEAAGLLPRGPVPWGTSIPEPNAGVYLVELVEAGDRDNGQAVLYIGRTKRPLKKRLSEFYRHQYGARAPHRGGQEVIPFAKSLRVYWAVTDDCASAENKMIEHFRRLVGTMPFANRVRSARAATRGSAQSA
jgi:hypothetical protein